MWLLVSLWFTIGHPQAETCRTMTARTGHAVEGVGVNQHLGKAYGDSTWERSMPVCWETIQTTGIDLEEMIVNRKQGSDGGCSRSRTRNEMTGHCRLSLCLF